MKIYDNNASEFNWIENIIISNPGDPSSNGILTMQNNLLNTYKVAENATVVDVSNWRATWLKDENGIPWGVELYGHEVCGANGGIGVCQGKHLISPLTGPSPYIFSPVPLGNPSQHRFRLRWYLDYISAELTGWYNAALWLYIFPKEEGRTFTLRIPSPSGPPLEYPDLNTIEFQVQIAYSWQFTFPLIQVKYDPVYGGFVIWRAQLANETQGWHEYDFSLADVIGDLGDYIDISYDDLIISLIEFGFEGKLMEGKCKVDSLYWYSPPITIWNPALSSQVQVEVT